MMKRTRIIVFFLFLLPLSSFASENDSWIKELLSFDSKSSISRQKIAKGLLKEVRKLDAYIPSLKPSEAKWLEKEEKSLEKLSGDAWMQKLRALSLSSESQTEEIKDALQELIKALECVLEEKTTKTLELYCWSYVSYLLTNSSEFNEAIQVLRNSSKVDFSKKVKEQFLLSSSDDDPWLGFNMFGRAIQRQIVMPNILSFEKK
ncbi:MAG: hypothetical protein ACC651_16230 [Candidatus Scalindua sp.]